MLTSWQCSVILLVAILALERFWSGERLPPGLSSYSVSSGDSFNHWDRLSSKHIRSQTHRPDTTVVILNWSRRLNVIRIVSLLCTDPVISGDVVLSIWNNSPDKLFHNVCYLLLFSLLNIDHVHRTFLNALLEHSQSSTRHPMYTFKPVSWPAEMLRRPIVSSRYSMTRNHSNLGI